MFTITSSTPTLSLYSRTFTYLRILATSAISRTRRFQIESVFRITQLWPTSPRSHDSSAKIPYFAPQTQTTRQRLRYPSLTTRRCTSHDLRRAFSGAPDAPKKTSWRDYRARATTSSNLSPPPIKHLVMIAVRPSKFAGLPAPKYRNNAR